MNTSMATAWMILAVMKTNGQKCQLQANSKLLVGTKSGRGGMGKGSFLKNMIEKPSEKEAEGNQPRFSDNSSSP